MDGKFCDGDCNGCEAIRNRQLTVILNALYKLFGDTVYKVVQKFCPNMTCCADCGIDDFCHDDDCELLAAAEDMADEVGKARKTAEKDGTESVKDVLTGMRSFAERIRWLIDEGFVKKDNDVSADLIESYVKRLENAYSREKEAKPVQRNIDKYKTRHDAYLAFEALPKPYWYEDDEVKAYIAVDFDEWLWLPVNPERATPKSWRKEYLGIEHEV